MRGFGCCCPWRPSYVVNLWLRLYRYSIVLAVTCLHEGMGLATQSHDMISLSHDYCNILIRILVFRHNGLIKY
uniref:Uncharacterized protein n=1 Tax=Oryza glumipatula TaxID=40148 RepID=A0A0E0BIA9_9ORYZ